VPKGHGQQGGAPLFSRVSARVNIAHWPWWRETGRVDALDLDADPLRLSDTGTAMSVAPEGADSAGRQAGLWADRILMEMYEQPSLPLVGGWPQPQRRPPHGQVRPGQRRGAAHCYRLCARRAG